MALLSIAVRLLNNEDGKTEGGWIGSRLELALAVHFVKGFVDNKVRVITMRVNFWFYSSYFRFPSEFKMNLHLTLWKNLNKPLRFPNGRVLSH